MKIDIIPKSLILQWHLTERCNWRCKHCYQENYATSELDFKDLVNVLSQYVHLIKKWKISKENACLSLTGGEPMLSDNFFPLLEKIKEKSDYFRYAVLSNGSLLTSEKIEKMKLLGVEAFQVSLEGMEEKNDKIRGDGSFKKIINSIKLLEGNGFYNVWISLSLNKKNSDDIEKLADYLASIKEKESFFIVGARRMVPLGSGYGCRTNFQSPLELKEFYRKVERINKKMIEKGNRIKLVGGCENGIFNDLISSPDLMSYGYCTTIDGRMLTVMPNGDVYPCRRLPIKIGNVLEESMEEIYYSKIMKNFRKRSNDPVLCKKCENYANCFGGAKCITYACTGKFSVPDVQCWRIQDVKNNLIC